MLLFYELIITLILIAIGLFYIYMKCIDLYWYFKIKIFNNKINKQNDKYYLKTLKDIQQEVKKSPLYLYYQNWIKN